MNGSLPRGMSRIAATALAVAACAGCGAAVPQIGGESSQLCNPYSPAPLSSDQFDENVNLTSTPSGLQYADLRAGCGALALTGKTLTIAYSFWLTDGHLFATSSAPGAGPFSFTLGNAAARAFVGLDFAFQGMRAGGKRRVVIPPSLAFGAQGAPPTIPPNATLIGDVQLLSVMPGQ